MKKALLAGVMLLALPTIASAQVVIITGNGPGWGGPGPWGPPGPVVHPGWGNVGWGAGGCGGWGCGGWGGNGVVVVVPGNGGPWTGGYGRSFYGSSVNYYEGGGYGW